MEPQYLLIQQIKVNAEAIEQNLRCLYDSQVPYDQKCVAMSYLYVQARQVQDLLNSLFSQFHSLERML